MNIDELLKELNINKEYIQNENGSYSIDLDNSNEYSKFLSKLDKAVDKEFLDIDTEASQAKDDITNMQYINDDFIITLLGDLEADTYKMVIRAI